MEPGLSVHLMVLNPPMDRLAMLVDYLSGSANEFVIVDTGSAPAVKQIMAGWPKVRLIETEFVDFATSRNVGLTEHKYEWTLCVDPDELPSVIMMQHIAWLMKEGAQEFPQAKGWLYWTRNYWGGVQGPELEYHWHCRVWKTESGKFYRPIHELVSLNGRPESDTRGTPVMPKAPRMAYLIHSKAAEEIARSDELYRQMGEISR